MTDLLHHVRTHAESYLPARALLAFIREAEDMEPTDETAFTLAEALYYLSRDYHDGQFSDLYKLGCVLDYQIGWWGSGEPSEEAERILNALTDAMRWERWRADS